MEARDGGNLTTFYSALLCLGHRNLISAVAAMPTRTSPVALADSIRIGEQRSNCRGVERKDARNEGLDVSYPSLSTIQSLGFPDMSENLSKSARVRAICAHARTQRAALEAGTSGWGPRRLRGFLAAFVFDFFAVLKMASPVS